MFEYLIKKKAEGAFLARRILVIAGYALLSFAFIMIEFLYIIPTGDAALVVIVALLEISAVVLLVIFTKQFLHIEYEYEIAAGEIRFYTIYGKKYRKTKLELELSDLFEVGEFDEIAAERLENTGLEASHVFISSIHADNLCYGLFSDENVKSIVYFEAPDEAIALIRKYNPSALRRAKNENDKYLREH